MTGLRFTSLGFSPLVGKAAVDNCSVFKRQLRSVLGSVDGAYALLVPHDDNRCEVRVAYDPAEEQAVSWAKRTEEIGPELWAKLQERRMEVAR
jgi:hypothetical protein